jgi:signal transduction histidine kinase
VLPETSALVERAFGGRFRSIGLLRREPGVDTHLAIAVVDGAKVVVKALRDSMLPLAAQDRFEQAALVLSGSSSPFLAPPIAVDRQEGILLVAARFAPGTTLRDRLASGPLDVDAALTVAASVLSALQDVHARGVLHRNLSTANVILQPGPPPQAILVDFGVAAQPADARYQSPEQLGLLSGGVAETADLYSLGVVLYECLSGSNPYRAASLSEVLRRHLAAQPPPLRSLGFAVPRALDEVIQRLLHRHARDRYQSAEAALLDVNRIAGARAAGREDPELVVGVYDSRRTLVDPAFVGREEELAALEDALRRVLCGEAPVVLIEAESGGGKSRLLEELEQRALQRGARVLRGQAADAGTAAPFQMLAGIAAAVAAEASERPAVADRIRGAAGDDGGPVGDVFPELRQLLLPAGPDGSDELRPERAARGLAALLAALPLPREPLVLLLDDLQWAGDAEAEVLRQLFAGARPGVLVVGAFRPAEVASDHWLRQLPARVLRCGPLPAAEVRSLLESMGGPLPHEAVAAVTRACSGNPFLAAAFLRGIHESGALAASDDGWRVLPGALDDLQASQAAAGWLAGRVDRLPPPARALLTAGALLGKTFDLGFAALLAGQGWPAALEAVEESRRRCLLWTSPESGRCSLVHDKLREELLSRLDSEQRRALHLAAARLFEERENNPFALAFHFDAAGERLRALPHALSAARRARARGAFETALRYYRIAEAGAAQEQPAVRARIAEELGYVLGIRARYDESITCFELAAALAANPRERARVRMQFAEILYRKGAQLQAAGVIETELRQLGHRVPASTAGHLAGIARDLFGRALRKLGRARLHPPGQDDRLAIDLFNGLVPPLMYEGSTLHLLWAQLRALTLAERHPASPQLAMACMHHAAAATVLGWRQRSARFASRARQLAREMADPHAEAGIAHYHGVILAWSGQVEEALAIDREVLPLLEKLGDVVWARFARGRLGLHLLELGRLREAAGMLSPLLRPGPIPLDPQTESFILEALCIASAGRVSAEAVAEARKRCPGLLQQASLTRAEGVRLLAQGRYREAAAEFAASERIAREGRLRPIYSGNSSMWLATALRLRLESEPGWPTPAREELLAEAETAVDRALATARRCGRSLPHALREQGLLLAHRGKLGAARAALDRSLREARRLRAQAEAARTLVSRGQLGLAAGWAGAAEDRRAGLALLQDLGGDRWDLPRRQLEPTASLIDRYQQILDAGRSIASALSVAAVHGAATEAARRLLRCEEAEVVGPEAAPPLAARALQLRAPLIDDDPGESASSSLAAPIFVHGVPAGCLVAKSRVRGLFGAEEERLAGFVVILAGAALENAFGFEQIRRAEREIRDLTAAAVRGQEDERKRLAQALHDGAGQVLTAIALRLGVAARTAPAGLSAQIEESRELAEGVLEDLRRLTHDLRPAALDRLGLSVALAELARTSSTPELAPTFRSDAAGEPAPEVAIALYRIAQAAMANLLIHAQARNAGISLEQREGALRLTIFDDGQGFDPARAGGSGLGLLGMRERATWLGGSFRVTSAPGSGTRIVVEVPDR